MQVFNAPFIRINQAIQYPLNPPWYIMNGIVMIQLSLQFLNNTDTIRKSLETMTGRPVSLSITNNTASLLSIRPTQDFVSLRMHWMFLKAGDDIIREIAHFIRKRKGRTPLIRQFIHENKNCIRVRDCNAGSPVAIRTKGRFHDLGEMFASLNDTYFGGGVSSLISWGKRNSRRIVRRRILGSFSEHTNTIWINPVLDRRNIPAFFLRNIIYHEMLHSVMKQGRKNGRRLVHSPAFRERERMFGEYEKAVSWEKKHFIG
jgi:hypothetical protein